MEERKLEQESWAGERHNVFGVEIGSEIMQFKADAGHEGVFIYDGEEFTGRIKDYVLFPDQKSRTRILEDADIRHETMGKLTDSLADYYREIGYAIFRERNPKDRAIRKLFVMRPDKNEQCEMEGWRGYSCEQICDKMLEARVEINHLGQMVINVDDCQDKKGAVCKMTEPVYSVDR
ncbi:MAG: hypothetical protein WC570_03530 [Patescibacteria group bacterium]